MARKKSVTIMGAGNDPTAYINKIKSKQGNTYEIVDTRFGSESQPKWNNSPVATQQDITAALSSAMSYKGTAASTSDLPNTGQAIGDTYIASGTFTISAGKDVTPGDMIIWNGTSWDVVDLNQSGAITGGGVSGQVALFDTSSNIIGVSGITYTSSGTLTATAFSGNGASITNVNASTVNGYTVSKSVPSNANFSDTTYTFSGATNCFYVTPTGSASYSVTITPSIANNITGSGTTNYLAKFTSGGVIGNGPAFGSDTTKFLRNDGTWVSPGTAYTLPAATSAALGGIKIGYSTSGKNYAVQLSDQKAFVNVSWTDTTDTAGCSITSGQLFFVGVPATGASVSKTYTTTKAYLNPNGVFYTQGLGVNGNQIFVQTSQPSGLTSQDAGAIWFNIG